MSHRKISTEFQNFDDTMRKLIQVPHSEIKAQLEAEKRRSVRESGRLNGNLPLPRATLPIKRIRKALAAFASHLRSCQSIRSR